MTSIITKGLVTNGGIDRLRKVIGGGYIADNLLSCVREGGVGGGSSCCFSFRQDRNVNFSILFPSPLPLTSCSIHNECSLMVN